MDKISKIIFSVIIAALLFCSVRLFLTTQRQLRDAETILSGLYAQAEELRRENELLRQSLSPPGESGPAG